MSNQDEAQSGAAVMSLDDRIKKHHVTPNDLKCRCTAEHAAEIAKHFSEWRLADTWLNVTPDEVNVIEENHKNDENLKRKAFLKKWITKNGDDATYLMLLKALHHCERNDLVESLLKLIKQDDDHSTPASSTPSEPVKVSQKQVKEVLKKYLPDLSDLLAVPDNMSAIGIRLYSKGLIPKETYDNTITSNKTGRDKANSLLLNLEATIDAQPQLMKTLIEVLKKSEVLETVAAKMEQDMLTTVL